MKKSIILTLFSLVIYTATAQPGSDIYLFNFRLEEDNFYISNAQNITDSPGYDNQPFFSPDGENIYYSSDDGFGQTDIFKYNMPSKSERRITYSPESEYSPIITPDEAFVSCVILKPDGEQKLWKYPKKGAVPNKVSDVDKIGYYAWLNDSLVYAFVLGEPNTLESVEIRADISSQISLNPGVTIQKIPNTNKISYVSMYDKKSWVIQSYDPSTKTIEAIIHTVAPKSEYYTWIPSGILISGDGQKLYKFNPKTDSDWIELVDLGKYYKIKNFTRLAVNKDASLIAIVVSE